MSRIDETRGAFEEKDLEKAQEAHARERIKTEPWHDVTRGHYIGDIIYAVSDGVVTTFAIVAGATGTLLSSSACVCEPDCRRILDGSGKLPRGEIRA